MYNSLNFLSALQSAFGYDFFRHAFLAGTAVAIVAGIVGYFVVLRRSSFAAHGLSHIGFSGAAGAALIGVSPIAGLLAFTCLGGVFIALLGKKAASRDVQIGTVLAFMLGLGVLFISLYKGYATNAYSLLFGEILGISSNDLLITVVAGAAILAVTAIIYRRLLFASLDEDVAEAKGVPILMMNIIFMLLVAVATSVSVQIVGVLLIFSLMVTPAAIAQRLTRRPASGLALSVAIAVLATWFGLISSNYINVPVGFLITAYVFGLYLLARLTALFKLL